MGKKQSSILTILFVSVLVLIFRPWFTTSEIIGGDWPYFFDEAVKDFSLFPPAWSSVHGNGLGGPIIAYYIDQYLYLTAFFSTHILHIPWVFVYKIFWFGLFLFLSIFSSGYVVKSMIPRSRSWQIAVGSLLYTTNTYILMVVGGGQMGVALAYSIAPLVIARFMKLIDIIVLRSHNFKLSIVAGLVLAVQIMFDPRMAYITMMGVGLYALLFTITQKRSLGFLPYLAAAVGIAILLNAYWLLPILVTKSTGIPQGFFSEQSFQFFSFADFSHALSLLHPNWPENIFGKTYFLKSEFLALPILAFSSLLFIQTAKSKIPIICFALLGLVGAFLSKGSNAPFGEVNIWVYTHVPGMYLFRDPTKFYIMIALSYSILIPFTLAKILERILSIRYKVLRERSKILSTYLLILTSFFLIFLIRPAFFGQLSGTFKASVVPKEYEVLKDFLNNQPEFFRTLWVPKQQRFAFVNHNHPAIEAGPLFQATSAAEIVQALKGVESEELLGRLSIKYVIIPYDPIGEIFLDDRKYKHSLRTRLERELDTIAWLTKRQIGNITLYETGSYKDHVWLAEKGTSSYRIISPERYEVLVNTGSPNTLIFSENYSLYWTAKVGDNRALTAQKTEDGLMSFAIPSGKHTLKISYGASTYYKYGRVITGATLLGTLLLLIMLKSNERQRKKSYA